ncbi:serine hydrolase domain-containing protein [Blastomonas sp.]|uniref:serine hydrolase domain-containing protein n=1 Tax=Blastomonas sp. TaxID=1909299 RepID=UPI00391875F1
MKHWLRSPIVWTASGLAAGALLIGLNVSRGGGVVAGTPAIAAQATLLVPDTPERWQGKVDYAAFDARITRLMRDPEMAGLSVATVENGRLAFVRGYGFADREAGLPVTPQTVFRWASVSKGVAGTLAYKLAEEGKLSLSAPLASFGTSLKLSGGAEHRLAIPDLLAHRLGLSRNAYDGKLESGDPAPMLRNMLSTVPQQCMPGDCHSYQNVAYDAFSEIVGNATRMPYEMAAAQQLFAPLGMTSAGMGMTNLTGAASWARPYRGGRVQTLSDAYFRVPAAAGVSSNIIDLARWMQAQMGLSPQVISPGVRAEIHRPRVATYRGGRSGPDSLIISHGYGQGWRSHIYDGHWLVGHGGAVNGYRAAMWFDPATQNGIVMLWNSGSTRPFRLPYEFFDQVYGRPFTDWMTIDKDPRFIDPVPLMPAPGPDATIVAD